MRAVCVTWTEVSQHSRMILVPEEVADNPDDYDFANGLAELEDSGFDGLTREGIEVSDMPEGSADGFDLEVLTPEGY
ncbi:hypothetical protein SEA_BANTAM_157 [Gordonia phage Bantam]|uniref:Uncharacterized protein n=1 Tax=Gordonia phage Bantam TaxID=1887641 RepID=A0A1B3AYJ8_9CAUD|nr:hypothetical protein BIZ77_gp022 [Gordonia phage Bantam]AOE43846.1 hypothetical protein SEA_BANTAM_157 [Gordonia phage Bantam]